jgi:hypothetical protein
MSSSSELETVGPVTAEVASSNIRRALDRPVELELFLTGSSLMAAAVNGRAPSPFPTEPEHAGIRNAQRLRAFVLLLRYSGCGSVTLLRLTTLSA